MNTVNSTITPAQSNNLIAFMRRFREKMVVHYGLDKGMYLFGNFAPAIVSAFCKGESDEKIFSTLLDWADESAWDKIVTRTSTGCKDRNGVELFIGDKVRYRIEGSHTKKEYWNPEYEIIFKAPSFTLRHIGGGMDGGSHEFILRSGGINGSLEKIG